jgi:hypothetical protein
MYVGLLNETVFAFLRRIAFFSGFLDFSELSPSIVAESCEY